jgi:hypothetical protein
MSQIIKNIRTLCLIGITLAALSVAPVFAAEQQKFGSSVEQEQKQVVAAAAKDDRIFFNEKKYDAISGTLQRVACKNVSIIGIIMEYVGRLGYDPDVINPIVKKHWKNLHEVWKTILYYNLPHVLINIITLYLQGLQGFEDRPYAMGPLSRFLNKNTISLGNPKRNVVALPNGMVAHMPYAADTENCDLWILDTNNGKEFCLKRTNVEFPTDLWVSPSGMLLIGTSIGRIKLLDVTSIGNIGNISLTSSKGHTSGRIIKLRTIENGSIITVFRLTNQEAGEETRYAMHVWDEHLKMKGFSIKPLVNADIIESTIGIVSDDSIVYVNTDQQVCIYNFSEHREEIISDDQVGLPQLAVLSSTTIAILCENGLLKIIDLESKKVLKSLMVNRQSPFTVLSDNRLLLGKSVEPSQLSSKMVCYDMSNMEVLQEIDVASGGKNQFLQCLELSDGRLALLSTLTDAGDSARLNLYAVAASGAGNNQQGVVRSRDEEGSEAAERLAKKPKI